MYYKQASPATLTSATDPKHAITNGVGCSVGVSRVVLHDLEYAGALEALYRLGRFVLAPEPGDPKRTAELAPDGTRKRPQILLGRRDPEPDPVSWTSGRLDHAALRLRTSPSRTALIRPWYPGPAFRKNSTISG
jgi:hypothetical protein